MGGDAINATKIEWCLNPDGTPGYTWNPITGCLGPDGQGPCAYCYARRLANVRLKERYLANEDFAPVGLCFQYFPSLEKAEIAADDDPFYPRIWPDRLDDLVPRGRYDVAYPTRNAYFADREKRKGIFVCDMGELFGPWLPREWTEQVLSIIRGYPQHRFYLLTKQPQELAKWSPFPDNCWVGVSVTNQSQYDEAIKHLEGIQAAVKFLSIEPLLDRIDISPSIGYNGPVCKGDNDATKIQRGNSISGSRAGGIRDRRLGASLEGKESLRYSLGQGSTDRKMPQAASGKRYREILTSQSDGALETNTLPGTQAYMETLQRPNSIGPDDQSQERNQEGQSSEELGTSDVLTANSAHVGCIAGGESAKPKRSRQYDGQVDTRSCERDTVVAKGNHCRSENPSWPQGCGTGSKIPSGGTCNLGRDIWANVDIDFVIIGQQTPIRPATTPRREWVEEIEAAADKAGVKVFEKDSLKSLFPERPLRREWP